MALTLLERCFVVLGVLGLVLIVSYTGQKRETDNGATIQASTGRTKRSTTTPWARRTPEARQDAIHYLPGLPQRRLTMDHFSGYLQVAPTRYIFYWYVESQSDPTNDPVVLWSNGGPGCSGLLGFGAEHGPFVINESNQLSENPFSWNKVANMLYIEQPAGVGFSYVASSDDADDDDYTTGDAQAAEDNYQLILEFFRRFPERRSNPFFIASESYGGHYIPQLALKILQKNTDGNINFEGFLVGNPYVEPYSNLVAEVEAAFFHGLLPRPTFDKWQVACKNPFRWKSEECQSIVLEIQTMNDLVSNPYALNFPLCLEKDASVEVVVKGSKTRGRRLIGANGESLEEDTGRVGRYSSAQVHALWNQTGLGPPFLPSADVYQPCAQLYTQKYMQQDQVRRALHVHEKAAPWTPCFIELNYSKADDETPTTPLFQELVAQAKDGAHNLRMLIYSGDDDSVCATSGTQYWLYDLGAKPQSLWKAWKVQGQTAGFLTKFDLGDQSAATLSFATVHGAGHEVPAYRPMEALELFRGFLDKEW